ncbi:hypothetical protein HPC62_15880 [Thermoleptolyngbya sichuanensis A183]|uniref:Uncharacterized protein n=1 Tax=Thermoleptolyngbya sichuanensis A183 TaxID=2737172 RepID=A0A6M8BH10_9CYAN|nr:MULTISPECIES: hypothetical protein [Thermoleptolyngbya]QKD83480.1 hypothetical protein HPC62_15880 [Thermoleptolyngbya sichuanensis A183]
MRITRNRLRQDGLYFLQGIAGTCVVMGGLAIALTSFTLLLSAFAPGRFREMIRDNLPPDLPLVLVALLVGLAAFLTLLVWARFTSRRLALWTGGVLGAIALLSMVAVAIASP